MPGIPPVGQPGDLSAAWNQLEAAGPGEQNTANDAMARVVQFIDERNKSAATDDEPISDPDEVAGDPDTPVKKTSTADNSGGSWR